MQTQLHTQLSEILQKQFHFREFRPGQLGALTTLITHGRLLCIQPTGHGKSLLYQLPSILQEGIIPIPSRTWIARNTIVNLLANYLKIPAYLDLLYWHEQPLARQGELLNNDQRRHNVNQCMWVAPINKELPKGSILLLDDYTGSGATLNEAARALREHTNNEIIPFTLAAVKWRLGKKGMI